MDKRKKLWQIVYKYGKNKINSNFSEEYKVIIKKLIKSNRN